MKRFYKEVAVVPEKGGFAVLPDGRPLHTPGRHRLIVPKEGLAEAIAEEWRAQGEDIDKDALPLTGFTALALDVALPQRAAVIEELLDYGETDLLFYREDKEAALQQQQTEHWQPWVEWAQKEFGTRYVIAAGIMPEEQPVANRTMHSERIEECYDHWSISGLAAVTKATASLILGHGFMQGALDTEQLFFLSRLEEEANFARWGEDAEAGAKAEKLRADLAQARRWRDLLG